MNYRLIFSVLLFIGIIVVPASAGLTKIDIGSPVYIGEVGIDISSSLIGCRQIAWWPSGNDTSTPPGKIIDLNNDNIYSYNITPERFSGFDGPWYTWDKKPFFKVFDVQTPQISLKIWDIDHDRDVTGQSVPRNTRVTYRIETNLDGVFNYIYRPLVNPLDRIFDVRLKGPNGAGITNIYTGSAGVPGTQILTFDTTPDVRTSPYIGRDGGSWNHSARSGDGTPLYPLGTYTFTASQNLNNMKFYYGDKVGVTTSGPVNITFVPDVTTPAPTATLATPTSQASTTLPTTAVMTETTTRTVVTTPTKKPTWTSAPLPEWLTILAPGLAFLVLIWCRKNDR
jgi:hypothetical protein